MFDSDDQNLLLQFLLDCTSIPVIIEASPWAATVRGQRGHGPPLLLVPIIFWQNSTPFFGIFNFCSSNNDEIREILQPVRVKLKDLQKKLIQAHWGLVHINRKQD